MRSGTGFSFADNIETNTVSHYCPMCHGRVERVTVIEYCVLSNDLCCSVKCRELYRERVKEAIEVYNTVLPYGVEMKVNEEDKRNDIEGCDLSWNVWGAIARGYMPMVQCGHGRQAKYLMREVLQSKGYVIPERMVEKLDEVRAERVSVRQRHRWKRKGRTGRGMK